MKNRDLMRKSFVFDEQHHLHIDKSVLFTEDERRRHELCIKLLDTIKSSVSTFKPSESLANIPTLESISHESLYDYFVPDEEHAPATRKESKSKAPAVEIDLVISGGGLKGYFMTGCAHILKHELKKQNISIRRIAGASAGAWCGLFILTDFSTSNWIETYYLCRDRLNKTMHEAYEEMWPWAQSHLPDNAYEICSGRLFISITEVTWFGLKNRIISEFTSNRDLFEACLASSAIPYLTFPSAIRRYRDMWVLDGGLTNNTPIFPDRPRRALVFRLSDIFYPLQLLVSPKDACIESLVVRGAIQMSRFLQGEPSDSFSWVEYDGSPNKPEKPLVRKSLIFQRLVNGAWYSLLIGGSLYTLVDVIGGHNFFASLARRLPQLADQLVHRVALLVEPLASAVLAPLGLDSGLKRLR